LTDDLLTHFRAAGRPVDKWKHYFDVYERLLASYRGRSLTLVEVGVGDGGSLAGWRSYFGSPARIIGIDIDPAARRFESDGFEIIIGDQADPEFWARQLVNIGPIDLLIDDGGHSSVEQIVTVACALPQVRDGGAIVVEDTHTAYMPKQFPASRRFGFMQFVQHVVDVLHRRNPEVTARAPDTAGFGAAIHRVECVESMVIFHVDRRLCGPSERFAAGSEEGVSPDPPERSFRSAAIRAFDSQPAWLQALLMPARRLLGIVLRAAIRRSSARRVRPYFR
jgi:cephalosporin hydroxylase